MGPEAEKLKILFSESTHLEFKLNHQGNGIFKGQHGYEAAMEYTQYILDRETIEDEWVCISFPCERPTKDEKEDEVQHAVEVVFNRPEYNESRHDLRHSDCLFDEYRADEKNGLESFGTYDPVPECLQTDVIAEAESYIRSQLKEHPEWAEVVIAHKLHGQTIREYALDHGLNEKTASSHHVQGIKCLEENPESYRILHGLLADI